MNSEFQLAKKLYSKDLPPMLKSDILSTLEALRAEQTFDLLNPPLLTKYADVAFWKEGIKYLTAPKQFDNLFTFKTIF